MKKMMLVGSLIVTLTGIWMSSCEPSKKRGGSAGNTDTLSTSSGTQNKNTDITMHMDTTHQ